jgi:hypothetical protein
MAHGVITLPSMACGTESSLAVQVVGICVFLSTSSECSAIMIRAGLGGRWLSVADNPHVPDDTELQQLLSDVPGITFLAPTAPASPESKAPSRHEQR